MASLLENLIEILNSESAEYEKLAELAEKKTPFIVKGDINNLGKITEDEQEIVGTIQGIEKERNKILADIANVVNRDVETLKLINLIQMLEKQPAQQQMLVEAQSRLKTAIDRMRELNDKNSILLNDALDMVNFNLKMIQGLKSAPQTANYTKNAYNSGSVLGIFHGGFDAKQ